MAGYPVQRGHPPAITWEAAHRRLRDSGTLSGTSAEEEQMTGKIMPLRERDTSTIQAAAGAFLSSPRYANPNTLRGSRTRPRVLSWGFTRPLVLVDEAAQDESALDPLVGEVRDRGDRASAGGAGGCDGVVARCNGPRTRRGLCADAVRRRSASGR